MNKTNIEWTDMTWNPIVGCKHNCEYCYARRIAKCFGGYDKSDGTITTHNPLPEAKLSQPLTITRRNGKTVNSPFPFGFEPTFLEYRLEDPQRQKTPQTIFVCSMADLFGEWVPDSWIEAVFAACDMAPQHRYIFLTKNPQRYGELARAGKLPKRDNFWYGSTLDSMKAKRYPGRGSDNTFVSIEPLTERMDVGLGSFGGDRWIIIGAETGNRKDKIVPEKEWVDIICEAAALTRAAVFMKDSLIPIVGEENMRRELPWETGAEKGATQDAGTTAKQDTLMPAT